MGYDFLGYDFLDMFFLAMAFWDMIFWAMTFWDMIFWATKQIQLSSKKRRIQGQNHCNVAGRPAEITEQHGGHGAVA